MRKFIHSDIVKRLSWLGTSKSVFIVLMLVVGHFTGQAQNILLTECNCLNNDSEIAEGLFEDRIRIISSEPTWTIVSSTGLYAATSSPGSLDDFISGTVIPNIGLNQFELVGVREDNTNWQIEVSDGSTTHTISSTHLCQYPGPVILGDTRACLGTEDLYQLDAPANRLSNVIWDLDAGGTMISNNGGQSMAIEWGNVEGLAQVSVQAEVAAFDNQGAGKCMVDLTLDVVIAEEDTTVLACNNLLNISMNNNCELYVTPDMVLEDQAYPNDSYEIQLRDIEEDTLIPHGIISMEYLDKMVEVKVIHECSGNSCWGNVRLEDKSIPTLVCNPDVTIDCDELSTPDGTGYPVPDHAIVTQLDDDIYLVEGFDRCTDLIMRYEDRVSSVHCDGDYSSVISRLWSIMDDSGNVDTCSSRIFIRKASLGAITFPPNFDDNTGPNPSIHACSNFPTLPNGNPDPYAVGGTGAPEGMFCLNVLVDYEDTRLAKCDGDVSFKLRRKWTITDLCTAEQISRTQFIVVVDKAPPVCAAPEEFSVGTEGLTCGSEITLPHPTVIFECSGWDYFVSYKLRDDSGFSFTDATTIGVTRNADGTYTIEDIPGGQDSVWIVYNLEDDCGNMSQCFTEVAIVDDLPPVPVCDQNNFVALNDDGIAWAGVETFDDGSHDNCMIDTLEIRRMNPSPCGDPLVWSNKLKFCCEDVGEEVMISLRATDKAGNSNTCMVLVQVQDNKAPTLEDCPDDITVNCDADLTNLYKYGTPTVEDLCGADVEELDPIRNIDNCGRGTVTRRFVATDKSGNTASCQQIIHVTATNPFKFKDIRWPSDHIVTNGCMDSGIAPEDLPNGRMYPTYPDKACSSVTHDYKDIVFQYTDGYCFKILREWTVLDWCEFDGVTGAGLYKHTQVIKVENNIAPTIEKGCAKEDLEVTDLGTCQSRIVLRAEGDDDCSLPSSLKWSYELDLGNNGSVDYTQNTNVIDRVINHTTFKVTWTVTDECDNSTTCSQVFTVDDMKKPTPYCLTEIVTVIMQVSKEVSIWASDFDRGSFDNCTDQDDLKFSFSQNTSDNSRTFTCDQLVDGELVENLEMYVTDDAGNFDYCTVSIRVQDNSGNCDEDLGRVALGGKIANEDDQMVEDVRVYLDADLSEFPKVESADNEGEYLFENLVMYTDYRVDPVKEGDYLDGVSTLDLVLIQRHILEISKLNSPYKVIASDINADEKVSASDLVELRKLILGITDEFSSKENWRFIDESIEFAYPNKPFPYESSMLMPSVDHDVTNANFVAVKVGDVNNSHETFFTEGNKSENRSRTEWTLDQNTVNNLTKVNVNVEEKNLVGFQFAIEFDPEQYSFEGVEANEIDLNASHIGLTKVEDGHILISWNSAAEYNIDGTLLTFLLTNKTDSDNQIVVNPGIISPEVYSVQGIVQTQQIDFRNEHIELSGFELFQNIPNPFNNSTKIGFNLSNDSNVSLKVFDYSGKLLLEKNGEYTKGYNSIDININELNATGVLYYQIDTETQSASKKMIVIK